MTMFTLRDFWAGLLFAAVGAAFLLLAQQNSLGSAADMGPAYFPSLIAGLLIILGAALSLRAVWVSETIQISTLRPLLTVVVATVAFGALLERLGLFVAIVALVTIGSFARPQPRTVETALLAVALGVVCAVVFIWGLGVLVPLWPRFG